MIRVHIITENTKGELEHARTIQMESLEALQQDVAKWTELGINYEPKIGQTYAGETTLTWTKRRITK